MSDDHVLAPGMAPTPFSANEIREGCPAGRTVVMRVEDTQGIHHRLSRFDAVDASGAIYARADCDADGIPIGNVSTGRVSWLELQGHASFPETATVRDDVDLDTPLGVEACQRYAVTDREDVTTFWFARQRPGMPVKVTSQQGARVVSTAVMVSDRVEPTPPG